MSLRTSLFLLALAFGVLTAIVIFSVRANSPSGKLEADLERLRTAPSETPSRSTLSIVNGPLPDLRDAPRKPVCNESPRVCMQGASPYARPVGATR